MGTLIAMAFGALLGAAGLLAFGFWLNRARGRNHGANSVENMRESVVTKLNRGG